MLEFHGNLSISMAKPLGLVIGIVLDLGISLGKIDNFFICQLINMACLPIYRCSLICLSHVLSFLLNIFLIFWPFIIL